MEAVSQPVQPEIQYPEPKFRNVLIIRFSAMGDVVLTVPVIQNLLRQYPNLKITVLTRPFFLPFFENIPQVTCYAIDSKGPQKSIWGLKKWVDTLIKDEKIEVVMDLHSVIRTWIMGFFFRLKGIPIYSVDKGRKEKKRLIQKGIAFFETLSTKEHESKLPLPHATERYRNVFERAGFNFEMQPVNLRVFNPLVQPNNKLTIGIAPFAAHPSKQWGMAKIYELVEKLLLQYPEIEINLFGGGAQEVEILQKLADYYPSVHNLAGKMSLKEEIQKISELRAFISMDSGNMHIASLTGIPVVSIWGGTHPDIGFSALYQPKENHIQIPVEVLSCRPCSVFGTAHCTHVKPFACMQDLQVDDVIKRLIVILK